jgi:small-conductance mechanosensitive channel
MDEPKGFFAALFDFSFKDFITTKVIAVLYGLGMLIAAIAAIGAIVAGFLSGVCGGIAAIILSPIIFLIWVIFYRVWLEVIVILFRIEEHTENIAKQKQGQP